MRRPRRSAKVCPKAIMKPMEPLKPMQPMTPMRDPQDRWWPDSLGDSPSSTGGQNDVRYAYFSDQDRLAVDSGDGQVGVYDTAGQRISGARQAQSGDGRSVVFTGPQGEVALDKLRKVSGD